MEEKVGVIPNLVVQGAFGPKECGVLLTNERSIFVLECAPKTGMGAVLGGAVGAAIAVAAASRKHTDFVNASPAALAMMPDSIVVEHAAIESLMLKKSMGSYQFRLEYRAPGGKSKKLQAIVNPPPGNVQERKRAGVSGKQAMAEYAEKVRQAYELALPANARSRAEWRF